MSGGETPTQPLLEGGQAIQDAGQQWNIKTDMWCQ